MSKINTKEKNLLLIVASLVIIKFGLIPIIEWQDEKAATLNMMEKQRLKMENLLSSSQAISQASKKLEALLIETQKSIPFAEIESYKINVQKQIANILEQQNVKIERSNWNNDLPGPLVTTLVFNMQISGRSQDIIATHFDIENAFTNATIDDLQFNIRRHLAKSLGTTRATYKINFLVQQKNEIK